MQINKNNNDYFKLFLNKCDELNTFKSFSVVPPESPLEKIIEVFDRETNIPLQIPLMSFFSLLSTHLVKHGTTLDVQGATIRPDIWTIVLANSGAGKTYAHSKLAKNAKAVLGVEADFPAIAGAGAFVEELRNHNNSMWFYDEIAQFIGGMEVLGSPTNQCKEYLLKTYDGDKIERITKKDSITIDNPQLTILGLNTIESFINKITDESFTDGFCQRFGFVLAKADPTRTLESYDWFNENIINLEVREAFEEIAQVSIHQKYVLSSDGFQCYRRGFRQLLQFEVSESFYRRLMYKSFKFALLFHIILGKDNNIIDAEDQAWAMRMTRLHLNDLKQILGLYNFSKIEKIIQRVETLKKKFGDSLTVRQVVQYEKNIKSVSEAKQILDLVNEMTTTKRLSFQPRQYLCKESF